MALVFGTHRVLSRRAWTPYLLQSISGSTHAGAQPKNAASSRWKQNQKKKAMSAIDEEKFWSAKLLDSPRSKYDGGARRKSKKHAWDRTKDRYVTSMLNSLRKKKVEEAEHIFNTMFRKKIRPHLVAFNVMIRGYAMVGDVKRAFKVFNDMKKRSLLPTDRTYSSMFNACSHAGPRAAKIVEKVQEEIERRNVTLNTISYNAQLAAMVHCRMESERIIEVFEEMNENVVAAPSIETYSTLLLAATNDPDHGLKLGLLVWDLLRSTFKPDLHCYNALVMCLRDAGILDQNVKSSDHSIKIHGLCNEHLCVILKATKQIVVDFPVTCIAPDIEPNYSSTRSKSNSKNKKSSMSQSKSNTNRKSSVPPNKLNAKPLQLPIKSGLRHNLALPIKPNLQSPLKSDSSRESISAKEDKYVSLRMYNVNDKRIMDEESVETLLTTMEDLGLFPEIRTYTLLASLFPDVKYLIRKMSRKRRKVPRDEMFFVAAINLRRRLDDIEGAKDLYSFMKKEKIQVIQEENFRYLAYLCTSMEETTQFFKDLEEAYLSPTIGMYHILVRTSIQYRNYTLVLFLLRKMKCDNVEIPTEIMDLIKNFLQISPKEKMRMRFKEYSALKGYYEMVDRNLRTESHNKESETVE